MYFDAFTKEILGHGLTCKRGCNVAYFEGLAQVIKSVEEAKECALAQLEEGSGDITVVHTDQGSVYTSVAYNEIVKEAGLVRSCSRAGKPTDNPINESLNGWIKEELFLDFGLADAQDGEVVAIIERYVKWYNNERPCASIGYRTPRAYFEEFMDGKVECKDTFASRVLDPTPKFVRKKLARAEKNASQNGCVGTSAAAFA